MGKYCKTTTLNLKKKEILKEEIASNQENKNPDINAVYALQLL